MKAAIKFIDSIHHIDAEQWQQLWRSDYPFIQHEFLAALEDSDCTTANRGWQPHHLVVYCGQQLIAAMPMYLKRHSYGEYVFDWSWAQAYEQHDLDYYPKLVNAIPFTPATGPRLATAPDVTATELIPLIQQHLNDYCQQHGISGWHCLFVDEPLSQSLTSVNLTQRLGCQFHWYNRDYRHFDEFLATFNSRKRKSLRKERQQVTDAGVTLQRLTGTDITAEHWDMFYRFYHATYLKRSGATGYLNRDFFKLLARHCSDHVLMICAQKNQRLIAAALCFFDSDHLYGRYWGCQEEINGLHFEACYYQGIEFAIEQGIQRFDPGAQGEHKIQRGFEPRFTYSNHYIVQADFRGAINDFLSRERQQVDEYKKQCEAYLPFKKIDH